MEGTFLAPQLIRVVSSSRDNVSSGCSKPWTLPGIQGQPQLLCPTWARACPPSQPGIPSQSPISPCPLAVGSHSLCPVPPSLVPSPSPALLEPLDGTQQPPLLVNIGQPSQGLCQRLWEHFQLPQQGWCHLPGVTIEDLHQGLGALWISSSEVPELFSSEPAWDRPGKSPGETVLEGKQPWLLLLLPPSAWLCCVRAGPEGTRRMLRVGQGQDRRERPPAVPGWILGQFLPGKGCAALAQLPRAGGESHPCRDLKSLWMWHSGTGPAVARAVLGEQLGWVDSEGFIQPKLLPVPVAALCLWGRSLWVCKDPLAYPGVVRPGFGALWAPGERPGCPCPTSGGSQELAAHPPRVRAGGCASGWRLPNPPPPSPCPSRDTALPLSLGVCPWQPPNGFSPPGLDSGGSGTAVGVNSGLFNAITEIFIVFKTKQTHKQTNLLKISKE
ncbi:uncharacterized protein LOC126648159 [Myiozetetes cayanensis]|uniref:uncharacterized protein LOC126648159 n=1 Tax=Myiozetetes cayanensis TaxID=478635 RepID=UPI00215F3C0B|nr:uncharacterized protein LOC126648159 [Myiozetetes cayanensis]XP_050186836.1 uncharacterized protein LOC126648159 [Myiozetetes cayanensis]